MLGEPPDASSVQMSPVADSPGQSGLCPAPAHSLVTTCPLPVTPQTGGDGTVLSIDAIYITQGHIDLTDVLPRILAAEYFLVSNVYSPLSYIVWLYSSSSIR